MKARILDRAHCALHTLRTLRPDRSLVAFADALQGATVLEPGGPSALFQRGGQVPVYPRLAALDTLDYREHTLWSGSAHSDIEPRRRLIGEARHIAGVADGAYDGLLASHVVEHLADPLGALGEWQRVVRPGGHVLLVVPHYEGTFDHRRGVTPLDHLRADAEEQTQEDDMTHVGEILELHDLTRDPGAPSREVFEERCHENASSRAMHHHVFDSRSVFELCRAAGLDVVGLRPKRAFDIVCLCRVGADGTDALGDEELTRILRDSPFTSDRGAHTTVRSQPTEAC